MMTTVNAERALSRVLSQQYTEDDTADIKAALEKLRHYEGLAEPKDVLTALRQAQVLMEFINAQVKPVREAWLEYLSRGAAL